MKIKSNKKLKNKKTKIPPEVTPELGRPHFRMIYLCFICLRETGQCRDIRPCHLGGHTFYCTSLFLCTFLQRCAVYCICERKCPPKPAAAVQSGRNSVCVLGPDYVDTTCSMLFLSNIQQSSTLSQE